MGRDTPRDKRVSHRQVLCGGLATGVTVCGCGRRTDAREYWRPGFHEMLSTDDMNLPRDY